MATKVNKPSEIFQVNVSECIIEHGCLMTFGSMTQLKSFLTNNIVNGIYINLCLDGTFVEMEDKTYVRNTNKDYSFYYVDDNTIATEGMTIFIKKNPDNNRIVFKLAIDRKKVPDRYFEWLETCYERMYIFGGKLFSLGSDLKLKV